MLKNSVAFNEEPLHEELDVIMRAGYQDDEADDHALFGIEESQEEAKDQSMADALPNSLADEFVYVSVLPPENEPDEDGKPTSE